MHPGDLRESIRRNIAEGLTRDEAYELIEAGLVKGGFVYDDYAKEANKPYPPEALAEVRQKVREIIDDEYVNHSPSSPGRSWLIANAAVPPPGQREGKPQDLSVEAYMRSLTNSYQLTRREKGGRQRDAVMLWQHLRFDHEVYGALHHEADRWTTEELAGQVWAHPGTGPKIPPAQRRKEGAQLKAAILGACGKAPYPDKFPFPAIFLGYGSGMTLTEAQFLMRAPGELRDRVKSAILLGHILTEDGYASAVIEGYAVSDEGPLMGILWFDTLRDSSGGGWVRSEFALEPWILPAFVNIINDHRTFILETPLTPQMRGQFKRKRKEMGLKNNRAAHTPPPYYTLRMKTKLIREKVRKGLTSHGTLAAYRTDVRAHERCRIARGPFPLDPELGAKFRKRGYKVFTTNIPDADTIRRLHERGQPYKRADEWLAILTTWIETHMTNNDESLPYIPAVRLPGEVKTKRQPTSSWADDPGR
jgi:hypothetical protein